MSSARSILGPDTRLLSGARARARRRRIAAASAVMMLAPVLAACATVTPQSAPAPAPEPTVRCPEGSGMDESDGCFPVDTEAAMDLNNAFRDRRATPEGWLEAQASTVAAVKIELETIRVTEMQVTPAALHEALSPLGFDSVQARESSGEVLFGASVDGGCVFGTLTTDEVTVEAGGYINDGGCLAMQ